jgi:hypothetical protein
VQSGSESLSAAAAGTVAPRYQDVDKRRLLIVIALLLWSFLLTYTFHVVLNLGTLFTHFFYPVNDRDVPVILDQFSS